MCLVGWSVRCSGGRRGGGTNQIDQPCYRSARVSLCRAREFMPCFVHSSDSAPSEETRRQTQWEDGGQTNATSSHPTTNSPRDGGVVEKGKTSEPQLETHGNAAENREIQGGGRPVLGKQAEQLQPRKAYRMQGVRRRRSSSPTSGLAVTSVMTDLLRRTASCIGIA